MRQTPLCLATCLPVLALAGNVSLSGKITDKSGHGIAGIWVGMETTRIATLTSTDGSWTLNGSTGVASRLERTLPVTRHLVREGGRLRVAFDGADASGRLLSTFPVPRSTSVANAAARVAAEDFDTLLYVYRNQLVSSTPVSSTTFQAGTVAVDTNWTAPYTINGDSIQLLNTPYVDVSCSSQNLSVSIYGPDTSKVLFRTTPEGFEMTPVRSGSSINPYPSATKFRRLSGTPGSVVGRFQYVGKVYRPTLASVPDSTKKIISEDSARSELALAKLSPIYVFTETSFSLASLNTPNFARQFLNDWSYADESGYYYYYSYDSTWTDERRYSDSAHYDITVQIVDSSTVRMTGSKNGEIVSLHATKVANGFDRTYTSSNAANVSGTRLATPTSCPEAASWYESFRSANYHTTSLPGAARHLMPLTQTSSRRRTLFPF
jgi:hypothetical protein